MKYCCIGEQLMKFGVSSMFFGDMSIESFFSEVEDVKGIRLIDLWYDTPFHLMETPKKRSNVIKKVIEWKNKSGLDLISHAASIDINPIAYNPALRLSSIIEAKKSLYFANDLGIKKVTLHGGSSSFASPVSRNDREFLKLFLNELLNFLENERLPIQICIENDAGTNGNTRPFELWSLFKEILIQMPTLGITLDLAHVLKTNGMSRCTGNKIKINAAMDITRKFPDRIHIIHISEPNAIRTHGRTSDDAYELFSRVMSTLKEHRSLENLNVILEYASEEFAGIKAMKAAISADIKRLKSIEEES